MRTLLPAVALLAASSFAAADTFDVAPGQSVQAAITAANAGDVIQLAKGTYEGDIDFEGKAVTVRGLGPKSVLFGTGTGPVVRFENDEGEGSVLDSVTVRGGRAEEGGGIYILRGDPVVVRCVVTRNRASAQGSGIWIGGGSQALIYNNLVTYSRRDNTGDPHGVEIVDASPVVVNNTICRGDSNGLILRGNSPALVANNIIAFNGSRVGGRLRGRGICDFSGGRATIVNNVFHRNRVAALLRDGKDFRKIRNFERDRNDPQVTGNRDGTPGFRRTPPRSARRSRQKHYFVRPGGKARNAGIEQQPCNDADGTRNDAGISGGPFAPGSEFVPDGRSCGDGL